MDRFDFVVIGAGAAGEAAAKARRRGASVAIVDRDLIGGSCSFWACIPSKSLLHSAAVHAGGGDYPWPKAADARLQHQPHRHPLPGRRIPRPAPAGCRGGGRSRDGAAGRPGTGGGHPRRRHPRAEAPTSSWLSAPSRASRTCRAWTRSRTGRTARAHRPASCRRACSSSAAGRPASSWPRSTPATASGHHRRVEPSDPGRDHPRNSAILSDALERPALPSGPVCAR